MKSNEVKKKSNFEMDYNEIMKNSKFQDFSLIKKTKGKNPNDLITKFSLYQDTPNSITSTNTSVLNNL